MKKKRIQSISNGAVFNFYNKDVLGSEADPRRFSKT